jgi:hypothetical protein
VGSPTKAGIKPGPLNLKGHHEAQRQRQGKEGMLTKLALGLPYSRPRESLASQERKIAALLRPLGKTGLLGNGNGPKKK